VAECPRAVAREASSRFAQVYAEGAEGADREGWVAQARFPSLEATLWVGCSGLRVGAQRLEPGKRGNRTPWCQNVRECSLMSIDPATSSDLGQPPILTG
jgi:hypothetical protein